MKLPTTPEFGIRFGLVVSIILSIIKFTIGILSGSLAIIGSALDSTLDIVVSSLNAGALWLSKKNSTSNFSYGLGKVQGFAAIFEGCVVLFTGIFLGWNGYQNLIHGITPKIDTLEILTMILAIIGTAVIMWNFLRIAKVNNSLIIKADALHYSTDLYMNGGILIALLASKFLGWNWADAVFAMAIAIWIIYHALPIIWSGITMLLDKALTLEEIESIKKIIDGHKEIESYHYLKTRRSGDDVFVEVHIVFTDKNISLKKAHEASESIENDIKKLYPTAHTTVHLDIDDTLEHEVQ